MAITYSISGGEDADKFTINATTGVLSFKAPPDYETPTDAAGVPNAYEVEVCATDDKGAYGKQVIMVNVTNVDENAPPQITSAPSATVAEGKTEVMTVTAIDPDEGGAVEPPINPPGQTLPALAASGTIKVTAHNTTIENKLITGYIECVNYNGLKIKNCIVNHSGSNGIFVQNCDGLTLEDVKTDLTNSVSGQNPIGGEWFALKLNNVRGVAIINRLTMTDTGVYAVISPANFKFSFIEGHDMRGPTSPLRGQLIQMNQCAGDIVIEDFSCENAKDNSRPEDVISIYQCGADKVRIRRGLLDGCNSPSGVMIMVENGTDGALIEDVDVIHHGNGAFSFYDQADNGIFRRCRMKDQIIGNQGRGNPASGSSGQPCNLVAQPAQGGKPAVTGARFEALLYDNISTNHTWVSPGTFVDMKAQAFTPRAPIRNRTPGT